MIKAVEPTCVASESTLSATALAVVKSNPSNAPDPGQSPTDTRYSVPHNPIRQSVQPITVGRGLNRTGYRTRYSNVVHIKLFDTQRANKTNPSVRRRTVQGKRLRVNVVGSEELL